MEKKVFIIFQIQMVFRQGWLLSREIFISDEEREYLQHRQKAEELRHQEILFKIERYAISLFALFFLVFNAVYWTDLLYSAKFSER